MAVRSLGFAIAAAAFVSGTAVGAFAWDLWGTRVDAVAARALSALVCHAAGAAPWAAASSHALPPRSRHPVATCSSVATPPSCRLRARRASPAISRRRASIPSIVLRRLGDRQPLVEPDICRNLSGGDRTACLAPDRSVTIQVGGVDVSRVDVSMVDVD